MREVSKVLLADTEGALFGVYLGEPITGLPSTWRIREREDQIILDSQSDSSVASGNVTKVLLEDLFVKCLDCLP